MQLVIRQTSIKKLVGSPELSVRELLSGREVCTNCHSCVLYLLCMYLSSPCNPMVGVAIHKLFPVLPPATAAATACSLLLHPSAPLHFPLDSGRAQHILIFCIFLSTHTRKFKYQVDIKLKSHLKLFGLIMSTTT